MQFSAMKCQTALLHLHNDEPCKLFTAGIQWLLLYYCLAKKKKRMIPNCFSVIRILSSLGD